MASPLPMESVSGLVPENFSLAHFAVLMAPALAMLLGSCAFMCCRIHDKLQAATQTFSAGILLAAIAGELFPFLSSNHEHPTISLATHYMYLTAGFVSALIFMFGVAALTEDAEEPAAVPEQPAKGGCCQEPDHEDPRSTADGFDSEVSELGRQVGELQVVLSTGSREEIDRQLHGLMYSVDKAKRCLVPCEPLDQSNLARMQFHVHQLAEHITVLTEPSPPCALLKSMRAVESMVEHLHEHAERSKFRRWRAAPVLGSEVALKEQIAWPLVLAVTTDAAVDGLLVGLSLAASGSTGLAIAIATCIEMGFLGLSFSGRVQNMTRSIWKRAVLAILPVIVLGSVGFAGFFVGDKLRSHEGLFLSFIAFAVVALLYLVTQELLKEAHEIAGDSKHVSFMLFVGVLVGIFLSELTM